MNEQFKKLALKAGCRSRKFTTGVGMYQGVDNDLQKFAELIVRECMTTILKESKWYWDKDEFESSNAIQNAARRLKEHFGVEE